MKNGTVLLFLVVVFMHSCHQIKIPSYPSGESIEVIGEEYRGYIFDKEMTTPWIMAQKELNYSSYWWLNECEIPLIENCLQEYVTTNLDDYVEQNLSKYLRQYFPFISKNGHQMVHITLSEIKEDDPNHEEIIENIGVRYRSVFDGREYAYYSILLDYSTYRNNMGNTP
ncbi:MAG: hypothetical protein AAFN81_13615 [Bacteroidota bacterium]